MLDTLIIVIAGVAIALALFALVSWRKARKDNMDEQNSWDEKF